MNIYNYYITHQTNKLWHDKFQSTSSKQSGKTFSYMNTNFRFIRSYLGQFDKFRSKLGKERKDWHDRLPCGQETDKHRITNLLQASFIRSQDSFYYITPKGLALGDLIDGNYNVNEQWFLLFLLLLDYKTSDRNLDMIYTVKNLMYKLKVAGANEDWIVNNLKLMLNEKEKKELFKNDLFWLISFANDENFVSLYLVSTENEKALLKNYVTTCSNNPDSTDLIAHKFKNSGAYSASTFNDDVKIIYFILNVINTINDSFETFIDKLLDVYKNIFQSSDINSIKTFISNHKSIYIRVKQNIMGGIN